MSEVFNSEIQTPSRSTLPRVSVVIPMFNAEKFLGACLESILNQTFQNFEVIVVDDCSTDSSCAIVESYAEKFGGRLKLARMEKNSGNGGPPRNKGLMISRGEYIFNMDADDMLTPTALEELYTLAKNFDADVVHCESHYEMNEDGSNIYLKYNQREPVKAPALHSEDLAERVKNLLTNDIWGTPWCSLVRRDLLTENEIFFQKVRTCEDHIWTLEILFFAKKFLRVPNAIYLYRITDVSLTRGKRTPQQQMNLWINSAILGLKGLDRSLCKINFFKNIPQARFDVLNYFTVKMILASFGYTLRLQPFEIYDGIKQEFGDALGEQDVLVAALCTCIMTLYKTNYMNVQKFNRFVEQAQKRIAQLEAELAEKT